MPKKVLFVCLGNICRSPAAEGVLQNLVDERQLSELVEIDSAGTSGFHIGELADSRMRTAAKRRGFELTSRSRMVEPRDFLDFDLIIAMDHKNQRELERTRLEGAAKQGAKLRLLSDYLSDDWPSEVPDPYYGGEDGFEKVLDMLEAACPKILEDLLAEDAVSEA